MKQIIFMAGLLLAAGPAWCTTVYLNPGDAPYRSGPDLIICGGYQPTPEPDEKWICTCFSGNKNLGQVHNVWARSEREAADIGKERCFREYYQHISFVSCSKFPF